MKQVLQDLKTGAVIVAETPDPTPARGRLLVRVQASLLSAGTEGAQVAKARQSLLERVREKPELLRQGWEELRTRGVAGVKERLASKLEGYAELGYSCAGAVLDNGDETLAFPPGTLVACAGTGIANHAELISARPLLTAAVPKDVTAEAAAYTTVGAIALQGVRQAAVQIGETVAVIGLGLVGLLTAQFLRAQGCQVAGIDPAGPARERGRANGCDVVATSEQAAEAILALSGGIGADAVIICAATSDSGPVELAGQLARPRGRVVMVGATGMTIPRQQYYLKELSFVLSRSYGPGRYDPRYEEQGQDYPVEYVRFTEQRNMQSFLNLVAQGRLDPTRLTTHRFKIEDGAAAYALLNQAGVDRAGIVLTYAAPSAPTLRFSIQLAPSRASGPGALRVGFIGAGAYAQGMLLPLLKGRADVVLGSVATRNGSHGLQAASRFSFEKACTRTEDVLEDSTIQVVFITTRHDSHATLACQALRAGKHVWVEKPLALTLEQLKQVWQALQQNPALRLVVGFNRPFSRSASWLVPKLGLAAAGGNSRSAPMMLFRVNAGLLPPDSWVNDPASGGGRLLGEGCHFFDFLRWVAGSRAESIYTEALAGRTDLPSTGNFAATVRFTSGAVGQVLYSSQGATGLGKEYFECFTGQSCGTIDDFQAAEFFQGRDHQRLSRHAQDKGQAALLQAFIEALRHGTAPPASPEEMVESSLLTLAAQESLNKRQPISLAALRQQLL